MLSPMDVRPDKVAIYIRWSTEDQGEGTTLVVQQEGCQHYVLSQGWQVTPSLIFIDDGYSGGSMDRPRLTDLRLAVKAGQVDCVVVYKLDRLSRSVMDTVNLVLDEWEGRTYVKSAREPVDTASPMGKQFFYMLVSYAEWERNVIKDRTHSGKLRRVKDGHNPGGPVPYGYRQGDKPGLLDVHEEQAEVVRRIYLMYQSEWGSLRIASELNKDGLPSPTGIKWGKKTIVDMLKNPLYAGRLRYGKTTNNPRHLRDKTQPWSLKNANPIETESKCPAIITADEFDRVQELMASRTPKTTGVRALSSENLLTGILRCQCGAAMSSRMSTRWGKVYKYYLCQAYEHKGKSVCPGGLIPQALLDAEVEQSLKLFLQGDESYQGFIEIRKQGLEAQIQDAEARRVGVAQALKEFEGQSRRLTQDYRTGKLSAESFEEARKEIAADMAQAKQQLPYLEKQVQSLARQLQEDDSVREIFDLALRWDQLDIPQRKVVLRNLVDSIVAHKQGRNADLVVDIAWEFVDGSSSLARTKRSSL